MVKQRFLTHFKPWLVAVIKVTGLIVAYQLFDQVRTYFEYASLSIANVVSGATALLFVIGLVCMITAWGECAGSNCAGFVGSLGNSEKDREPIGPRRR
jgi:hypothetical protein